MSVLKQINPGNHSPLAALIVSQAWQKKKVNPLSNTLRMVSLKICPSLTTVDSVFLQNSTWYVSVRVSVKISGSIFKTEQA